MNKNNNTPFSFFSMLCFLCLLSPALLAKTNAVESEMQQQHILSGETPQGITTEQWGGIQKQLTAAKYRASADENGGYRSANPAQGWLIQYAADGQPH
ncbi:MAG: hypothetical protein ACKE51_06600 [Methylococcaceae bacterium]